MTSSLLAAPRVAVPPRFQHVPEYVSTSGLEAVELAALAGLYLDPWQQLVLVESLGERPDGRWAAFEVGLTVPRQNGKDAILEARELAGMFLIGERLIIHSAHLFDTSLEHFNRLLYLIESTPDFDRRVKRVSRAHGEEGIELKGGQRIRFRTRTKGGGRGFSGDLLILNEAMSIGESAHGALLPTLSARPNPQVWYVGTSVDQLIHQDGYVFTRIRDRGINQDDQALAYFEWSADADSPVKVTEAQARDPAVWHAANPGLGIRITPEHVGREQRSMDPRTFAVERLGVGDWPNPDGSPAGVIDVEKWAALAVEPGQVRHPMCLAFDVSPDRSSASIAGAWVRDDGLPHVEVVDRRRGTEWVVERLVELDGKHDPVGVVYDGVGPAASLVPELQMDGVKRLEAVSAKEHAQACGRIFDLVEQAGLRHLGQQELAAAVRGATRRPLGDSWAWSRKSSSVDISPLVAGTLALWGLGTLGERSREPVFAWG